MASLDSRGLNETFDLLAHPHRRYVLYHLTNDSEVVSIDTLATAIAEWDGDHRGTDRHYNPHTVEIGLRHTHLPKLADAGIVVFGENSDAIELGETNGLGRFIRDTASIDGYPSTATVD